MLTQYLEKYWVYFHLTFRTRMKASNSEIKHSKFKVMLASSVQENALFGLVNAIS